MDYNKRAETISEEEEDEMMMLVFPVLYLASIRTKTRTPCYTSKLSGSEYTRELQSTCRLPWLKRAFKEYKRGYCRRTTSNVHVHACAKCKFYCIV